MPLAENIEEFSERTQRFKDIHWSIASRLPKPPGKVHDSTIEQKTVFVTDTNINKKVEKMDNNSVSEFET